jgi:protein-S-isoprenylcysteine O-methyltransferase Ste14/predicted DCC family thiol-disulfide oxidoreductase YuxK
MPLLIPHREALPAPTAWNVAKTLLLTPPLWLLFFVVYPGVFYLLESAVGLEGWRFATPLWQTTGLVLFTAASLVHLVSNLVMAVHGEGTPLFLDGPRRLVVAGPYRHVRNPMALAGLTQCLAVGLWLGSPLVLLSFVLLVAFERLVIIPSEVADLENRFGEAYRHYRLRVPGWRVRLRGYDPAREGDEPPAAAERTTPPGRNAMLYDGLCKFCTAGAKQLLAWAPAGSVELVNFQEPGVLARFPGVTHEACMRQMYLVTTDGRVYGGAEAAVRLVAMRPVVGWLAYLYYLPGVRLLTDTGYALVAANRYRIMGKAIAAGECEEGTCALHLPDAGMKASNP